MQLKNNTPGNVQLYFPAKKNGQEVVDYVHIPHGATVEIEDELFLKLTSSMTEVKEWKEVVSEIETGANPIQIGKDSVKVKDYFETGVTRKVNLLKERIKAGDFTIVERVAVAPVDIDKFLNAQGISIKEMSDEQKQALYDKLA